MVCLCPRKLKYALYSKPEEIRIQTLNGDLFLSLTP